jgi:hypothetical protein
MIEHLCLFNTWEHGAHPVSGVETWETPTITCFNYVIREGQLVKCDFGGLKYCEDKLLSVAPIMVWNIFRLEYNQATGHTERHMTMIPLGDRVNMTFLLHNDILEQAHRTVETRYVMTYLGPMLILDIM